MSENDDSLKQWQYIVHAKTHVRKIYRRKPHEILPIKNKVRINVCTAPSLSILAKPSLNLLPIITCPYIHSLVLHVWEGVDEGDVSRTGISYGDFFLYQDNLQNYISGIFMVVEGRLVNRDFFGFSFLQDKLCRINLKLPLARAICVYFILRIYQVVEPQDSSLGRNSTRSDFTGACMEFMLSPNYINLGQAYINKFWLLGTLRFLTYNKSLFLLKFFTTKYRSLYLVLSISSLKNRFLITLPFIFQNKIHWLCFITSAIPMNWSNSG